ncbi:MAG: serine/threonine-protein kinase [Planctomycetota bacterium]|jgi:hypothetical protein
MEMLKGQSLRAWLDDHEEEGVRPQDALEITRQLLEALTDAHEFTVHRDLKPENVFVVASDTLKVKILDFGIAKLHTTADFTRTNMALGTVDYMAPEQRRDAASVDQRADLYSVCVMLYEMLTGELPVGRFNGRFKTPTEERKSLPPAIDPLVLRGLAPKPAQRFPTAERLLAEVQEIRRVLDGGSTRRRRSPLFYVGILVLLCGAGFGTKAVITMRADAEAKRVAADREAAQETARVAAEQEVARVAMEQETARVAAEQEAARVAAEEESARLAELLAEQDTKRAAAQQEEAQKAAKREADRLAAEKEAARLAAEKEAAAAEAAANKPSDEPATPRAEDAPPPPQPDKPPPGMSKDEFEAKAARKLMEKERDACSGLAESDFLQKAREKEQAAHDLLADKRYVQARAGYDQARACYETARLVGED